MEKQVTGQGKAKRGDTIMGMSGGRGRKYTKKPKKKWKKTNNQHKKKIKKIG